MPTMNNYVLMAPYTLIATEVFIIMSQTYKLNIRARNLLNTTNAIGMQLI